MNKNWFYGFAAGLSAGAATMYFLDPDRGPRRRALLNDKINSTTHKLTRAVEMTKRDLSNRGYGMLMEARHMFRHEDVADDVLEARIRSKMGRYITNPHGIQVSCQNGNVTLTGSLAKNELSSLLCCIDAVPGVNSIDNRLEEQPNQQTASPVPNTEQPAAGFGSKRPHAIH